MSDWFDDLTKTLGDDQLPRRQALRRISGMVTGLVLAAWFPGTAQAQIENSEACKYPCNYCNGCSIFSNCKKNQSCFCFARPNGAAFCGCNGNCSSFPLCTKQSDCPSNTSCVVGTPCSPCDGVGICITGCSVACIFHADGSGRTAAGV